MPWQQQVADVALELGPDGRLVYREVCLTVPRQSGKTTLLLALMVDRAINFGERQTIRYTAQTRNDAFLKWHDEHLPTLEQSVFRGMYRTRLSAGQEALQWKNGSHHSLMATTKKSGHGGTIDLGVLDEAFAQPDNRIEQALKPAMITRPQPQLWIVSTAGDETATYLWQKVQAGRKAVDAGRNDGVAYFEWSAPMDGDPFDPAVWHGCMPALGITVPEAAIRADADTMEADEFRRAYLNHWIRSDGIVAALPGWEQCRDPDSASLDPTALGVDVSPDLMSASIAVAGESATGGVHLEVVQHELGTAWVVPRVARFVEQWHPTGVYVSQGAPVGALLPYFAKAGVEVHEVGTGDHAKACGWLYDAVKNRGVRHLGQPPLDTAVDGAVRRSYGDSAWLWSRRNSTGDVSPLVATTLALHGHVAIDRADPHISFL